MGAAVLLLSLVSFLLLVCFVASLEKWAEAENELEYLRWMDRMRKEGGFS